jgi:hypothetical protein
MDLTEIGWEYVECINLPKDTEQWRDPVNREMNLLFQ